MPKPLVPVKSNGGYWLAGGPGEYASPNGSPSCAQIGSLQPKRGKAYMPLAPLGDPYPRETQVYCDRDP